MRALPELDGTRRPLPVRRRARNLDRRATIGLATAVGLMALAMVVPAAVGWDVHANHIPPLFASWRARVGAGTAPALAIGLAAVRYGPRLARTLPWPRLLVLGYLAGLAWAVALATVDGWAGIGRVFDYPSEYLKTAREVSDVGATLREFVDRIPATSAHPWATHVAGHPPGALLFFVLLVRVGLGGGLAAGGAVIALATTTPLAVLITLRRLGAEHAARRAAPVLVIGPAALWLAVSADALFGAVAAWSLCCLAVAATAPTRLRLAGWSLAGGLLLGCCLLLSYGLALLAFLALGVLVAARELRPLLWAATGAAAVVLAFVPFGFVWWDALPVLRARYYAGIAAVRPAGYWVWGDFAALCFSAGPIVGASLAVVAMRWRSVDRPTLVLTTAALLTVVLADLSFMSKAEVERIWLPFVPWLLLGAALPSERWRQRALAGQVVLAFVMQSVLSTHW